DVEFDYLHATRYRGATTGSRLAWLHRPATPMRGRRVLLVDDILDEGHTLKAVKYWCEDQGAIDVRIAVLATKAHDLCEDDRYAGLCGRDVTYRSAFGFGMDFHEQGRNLYGTFGLRDRAPPGTAPRWRANLPAPAQPDRTCTTIRSNLPSSAAPACTR